MNNSKFINELIRIVGDGNVSTNPVDLICYSRDASEHVAMPEAVVWPSSTEEVSRIVKLAYENLIPITPRGAGTCLTGGPLPAKGGIVVDLTRMNRILEVNEGDMYTVVEAGVVWASLNKELRRRGYFFPPDPASGDACTIGGCIALNSGGIRAVKYGTTREWVLGLEVVLPNGGVTFVGSRTRKCVSGYDLTRLFIGSEGTLGVITKARLKIRPLPECQRVTSAFFRSVEEAGEAIYKVMAAGLEPSAAELLDRCTLDAVSSYSGLRFPSCEAMIIVELDGSFEDVDVRSKALQKMLLEGNALDLHVSKSVEESEQIWAARRAAAPALASVKPTTIVEDATVPISKVPAMIKEIGRIAREYDVAIATFGHAGDGNLHPNILLDERNLEEVERARRAAAAIFKAAISLGGTLSGEHGIGLSKAPFMALEHSVEEVEVMRRIKRVIDPRGIMNPGKIF